jgi:hypothetical protein
MARKPTVRKAPAKRGAPTRDLEPGKQRRATGSPSEMAKAVRETRLRQRY